MLSLGGLPASPLPIALDIATIAFKLYKSFKRSVNPTFLPVLLFETFAKIGICVRNSSLVAKEDTYVSLLE